jgi:hypothetical protein
MAILKIKAGENPARVGDIRLMYGEKAIENARVIEAYNDHGKKRVIAEIIWEEELGNKTGEKDHQRKSDGVRSRSVVEPVEGTAEG